MALADIIERIGADAEAEAAALVAQATERADAALAAARARAEASTAETLAVAQAAAARDAETIVVNARLRARDAAVAARRALIADALDAAAAHVASLPDDRYAELLAGRIADAARGGETLAFGSLDTARSTTVVAALKRRAPGLELTLAADPAPFEHGALLTGDRVRVDLSLEAIVADRKDELELVAAAALFGEGA